MRAVAVIVDGPYSGGINDDGEHPVWYVQRIDDDDGEVGKAVTWKSFDGAVQMGYSIARQEHLELVLEASPA